MAHPSSVSNLWDGVFVQEYIPYAEFAFCCGIFLSCLGTILPVGTRAEWSFGWSPELPIFYLKIGKCQTIKHYVQTPPSLISLFTCGVFLNVWCSSKNFKQTIILCTCFRIFEKTPHTTCTCEDSTVICWNTCHHWSIAPQHRHWHGACFVLKSFFVYKYLWGVSGQLS